MKQQHLFRLGIVGCAFFGLMQMTSMAADAPANAPAPTKEQRETMAKAHEKAAACLRTARPVGDCHAEMMQACGAVMGNQGCGMMGAGMMNGNMMHGQKPNASPPAEPKKPEAKKP